jgi:hypothetical protein
MRRQVASVTGVGVSAPVAFGTYTSPFNIGFGVTVSGTGTFNIEHTFDDVFAAGYTPAAGNWYTHPSFSASAARGDGNYAFPITAARINVLTSTASMVVGVTFIQAGQGGV